MTDLTQYRLSLVLAIAGALTVLVHTVETVRLNHFHQIKLPRFVQSAPDVREWPVHQYLPIG